MSKIKNYAAEVYGEEYLETLNERYAKWINTMN